MKVLKLTVLNIIASAVFFNKAAMAETISQNALQSYHNCTLMMTALFGSIFLITLILFLLGNNEKK